MTYEVVLEPVAQRQFEGLPKEVQVRVSEALVVLSVNPRPPGCKKLKPPLRGYRVRVGNYRILYCVFDRQLVVSVFRIAKRGDAY